jgi:hypothetical protein
VIFIIGSANREIRSVRDWTAVSRHRLRHELALPFSGRHSTIQAQLRFSFQDGPVSLVHRPARPAPFRTSSTLAYNHSL